MDQVIGYDSNNPTTMKEIGKSLLFKAQTLTRIGDYKHALFKYYEAFRLFTVSLRFHSNSNISSASRKRVIKDVDLMMVSLISITQVFYHLGQIEEGYEALLLLHDISKMIYNSSREMNKFIASMGLYYSQKVDHR